LDVVLTLLGRLWFNGHILTMDKGCPLATVMATRGPNIIYVGEDLQKAAGLLPNKHEKIDLLGQTVLPGLIDSHAHVLHEGLCLGQLDLHGLSKQEALGAVFRKAQTLPPGAWIHGRGWDQNIWADRQWPGLKELDQVSPDNPVVLDRIDKHSIWVNSQALKLSDPKVFGPDPEGGEILRDSDGSLRGVFIGQAMFLVYKVMPPLDGRDRGETYILAHREMVSLGLTTVIDAATSDEDFAVITSLMAKNALKFRYRAYVHPLRWRNFQQLRPMDGLFEKHLAIDGLKLFSDGSLGSRSAWLLEDYSDRPGHKGSHNYDDQELSQMLTLAKEQNLQVAIHVIGDGAVDQAVRCMEKVLGPNCGNRRWRLEHYQVAQPQVTQKVLAMGLIPSIQSVGLMTDLHMACDRLGLKRLKNAYAWRDILDHGGYLINGSDCPVESANPFHGIYAAVSRQDLAGNPPGGFYPEHCLSREEALATYTVFGGRAAFQENNIGAIKPGLLADLAVIDRDILTCPVREIADILVTRTVIGGETVYLNGEYSD
jgi:predicted amidohydrolase YtcJ